MRKLLLPALVMCSCGVFYKLTLQTEGAGTLTAAPSKRGHLDDFDAFEVAKLTATPDSGWTVANWQGNSIVACLRGRTQITTNV